MVLFLVYIIFFSDFGKEKKKEEKSEYVLENGPEDFDNVDEDSVRGITDKDVSDGDKLRENVESEGEE